MADISIVSRTLGGYGYWDMISTYPSNHIAKMITYKLKNNTSSTLRLLNFRVNLATGGANTSYWWGYEVIAGNGNPSQVRDAGTWIAYFQDGDTRVSNEVSVTPSQAKVLVKQRGNESQPGSGAFYPPTVPFTFTLNNVSLAAGETKSFDLYATWRSGGGAYTYAVIGSADSDGFTVISETPEVTLATPSISLSPSGAISVGESSVVTVTLSNNNEKASGTLTYNSSTVNIPYSSTSGSKSTYTFNSANYASYYTVGSDITATFTAKASRASDASYIYKDSSSTSTSLTVRYVPRNMTTNGFTYAFKINGSAITNNQDATASSLINVSWSAFALNKHLGNFNWCEIILYDVTSGSNVATLYNSSNDPSKSVSKDFYMSNVTPGNTYKLIMRCTYAYNGNKMTPHSTAIFNSNQFKVLADIVAPTLLAPANNTDTFTYCNKTPRIVFKNNTPAVNIRISFEYIDSAGVTQTQNYNNSSSPSMFVKSNGLNPNSIIAFRVPDVYSSSRDKYIYRVVLRIYLTSSLYQDYTMASKVGLTAPFTLTQDEKILYQDYTTIARMVSNVSSYYSKVVSQSQTVSTVAKESVIKASEMDGMRSNYNNVVTYINDNTGANAESVVAPEVGSTIKCGRGASNPGSFLGTVLWNLVNRF